jgi:hypothetical protein
MDVSQRFEGPKPKTYMCNANRSAEALIIIFGMAQSSDGRIGITCQLELPHQLIG